MLGRSLKDSATRFTVMESLNPRMVWVRKDLKAQPCSTGRDTFPWTKLLQRDACDDLLLENPFLFSQTQNNTIMSESVPSQAAQGRELCHCWHQAHAAISEAPALPPHMWPQHHSCSQRAGDTLWASPCWVTFPTGNGWLRTPGTGLGPVFLQDVPSEAPVLNKLNRC